VSDTTITTVETLTAQVRVLMVGNRQITLSVAKQLDEVRPHVIHPFGRIKTGTSTRGKYRGKDPALLEVIGEYRGDLVRASVTDRWLILAADPDDVTSPVCDECGATPHGRARIERRRDAVWTRPAALCPPCRETVHHRAGRKVSAMVAAWRAGRAELRALSGGES
jgi:TPP-dependent indolepyruvate ferredoxin oxidoreductase alpha subunit